MFIPRLIRIDSTLLYSTTVDPYSVETKTLGINQDRRSSFPRVFHTQSLELNTFENSVRPSARRLLVEKCSCPMVKATTVCGVASSITDEPSWKYRVVNSFTLLTVTVADAVVPACVNPVIEFEVVNKR